MPPSGGILFGEIQKFKRSVMGLKEAAPGVLVKDDMQVSIPHPDPAVILINPTEGTVLGTTHNELLIFSSEEKAGIYLAAYGLSADIHKAATCHWKDLVMQFEDLFEKALLDHSGKPGFYQTIPLEANI
jgi:hypothetical protein